MGFGVFVHRADSTYEDSPSIQYQFPKQYLSRVQACVGDWIVYYEPTKVRESRGYYAAAIVRSVVPDPSSSDMYLALIQSESYLDFAQPVPFAVEDGIAERGLLNAEGKISGRAQSAVRALNSADFNRIISRGLVEPDQVLPRFDLMDEPPGFEEPQAPFVFEQERRIALFPRKVRDRVFRSVILRAYDSRCAITGLKLINGGGRAEVEAAHIKPVEASGPDSVNNGIALSGTVHWMFDRGLVTLSDDLEILVSRHVNDRQGIESIINPSRRLIGPVLERDRPHPAFLSWHRENCFKT